VLTPRVSIISPANSNFNFDGRKVITGDGIELELKLSGFSTALIITKNNNKKILWTSGVENCHSLSLSPNERYVAYLCELSDVVIFSAAIPSQGGNGHINEQWQSYWAEIFKTFGMQTYDLIRPRILDDDSVLYWYRQNTLIFTRKKLSQELIPATQNINVVHPLCYESKIPQKNSYLKNLLLALIPNIQTIELIRKVLKSAKFLKK
jgi:hypothetical protein